MPTVVGIRFKDSGKTYFFDPNGLESLSLGDHVVVETVRGPELAKVAAPPREVEDAAIVGELKPVIRRAEQGDFDRLQALNSRQGDLLARCDERIREHGLPMRLVKAEYSFDGSRLTFYFTAEKRVDFRNLVRDLARTFRARIELRQIGPRDEAKLLGGIGPCGRLLCCATFLPDYARVSIKMAKDQDLPLNPTKISGVCGRLLCCLSYEHEQYIEIKSELPKRGSWVQTPDGPGEVVAVNVVRETVTVELAASNVQVEFVPSQIQAATRDVAEIARGRNREGITPAARREPKPQGERRLLRDEIADPDVLDALELLEEGAAARESAQPPPLRMSLSEPGEPPARAGARDERGRQPRPSQHIHPHVRGERRADDSAEPQPGGLEPLADEEAAPRQPGPGRPRQRRRRRGRGGKPGAER